VKFLRHRIADERILRLVTKWLNAGVLEDGKLSDSGEGTPQGALCAAAHNDPYEQRWVMRSARGLPLAGAVSTTGRCA
jgi:RNA-directed DNA polymerase